MRVLVIGCGSIGQRHIANLRDLGCVVDAYDVDPCLTEAVGIRYRSYWKCLDDGPDAVVVATPAAHHTIYAMKNALEGRAVFIEKPLATTVEDCERICEAADKAQIVAMVGHQWRFHPEIRRAKEREPHTLSLVLASKATNPGVGVPLEYGTHCVDIARYILGDIIKDGFGLTSDDALSWAFEHERGMSSLIAAMGVTDPKRRLRYETKHGKLSWGSYYADLSDPVQVDEMYKAEMAHFLDCVRGGKTPEVTLRDGTEAVRWALACAQ